MERAKNKFLRVLQLLDAIAHLRKPFTLHEAIQLLEDKHREQIGVHERTIRRDIQLLESMNLVYLHRKAEIGSHSGSLPAQYKVDPVISRNLAQAARSIGRTQEST